MVQASRHRTVESVASTIIPTGTAEIIALAHLTGQTTGNGRDLGTPNALAQFSIPLHPRIRLKRIFSLPLLRAIHLQNTK